MRRRKCRACGEWYKPELPDQRTCSVPCAIIQGRADRAEAEEEKHRARKKQLRHNDKSAATKAAQQAFNAFIRQRDAHLPCVSCGRFHNGKWNAGHFRPAGGQGSALRFNEINVHRQCEPCNSHLSGNLTMYRPELIRRIGLPLVEWLEKDHPPANWTCDELWAIRDYYKRALKEMQLTPGEAEPF